MSSSPAKAARSASQAYRLGRAGNFLATSSSASRSFNSCCNAAISNPTTTTPANNNAIANTRPVSRPFSHQATAKMSTMPAQHGHSVACCNIPPVVSKGYEGKGSYEQVGEYNTYSTGPSESTKGIVCVFDIFGYFPQTVQGMDILATSGAQKYRVLVPDWFKGKPCPIEWFPPDNEEKQKNLGEFFQEFPPQKVAAAIPAYVKAAQEKYPHIKDWGIIGFCWGGKVITLATAAESNPFKAAASCHPAMVDPADAQGVKVPLIMLPSKDEDVDDVKKFEEGLKVPNRIETYPDQIHGWMAARSDLEDPKVREAYTKGYESVIDFFSKHL